MPARRPGPGPGTPPSPCATGAGSASSTDSLPESEETTALGLAARIFQLQYSWRLGISHEEAEQVFEEAERMASKSGDVHSRAVLLAMYGVIRGVTEGDVASMEELSSRSIALAQESGDPALYMAVAGGSYSKFLVGDPRGAIEILDRGIELAGGDATIGAGIVSRFPVRLLPDLQGWDADDHRRVGRGADPHRPRDRGVQ